MSDRIYPFTNEQIADLIELLAYVEGDERRHYNGLSGATTSTCEPVRFRNG
jgi:hypothetical protein